MKLGDIFEMQNGRAFKKEEWVDSGIPIIRIANLNGEKAEYNYFSGIYDNKIEINNGDLLFSWSGTIGTSFGPNYWERGKGVLNQHIYKFNKKDIEIDTKFA
ncbi:MAG: restriction endonuclease subunit S, partial [candidate division SR1 bacterium]|nr:restriction endonuclease subunit S [candidate division SR1 bacterium]